MAKNRMILYAISIHYPTHSWAIAMKLHTNTSALIRADDDHQNPSSINVFSSFSGSQKVYSSARLPFAKKSHWKLTRSSPPEASNPNFGLNLTHRLATPSIPPLCNVTIGSKVGGRSFFPVPDIRGTDNFSSPSTGLRSQTYNCPSFDPEITNLESPDQETSSPLLPLIPLPKLGVPSGLRDRP